MPRFTVQTVTFRADGPWVIESETTTVIEAPEINTATERANAGLPPNQRAVIVGVAA